MQGHYITSSIQFLSRRNSFHTIFFNYFFRAESVKSINIHAKTFSNTSHIATYIAVCMDTFGLSRKKAVAINFILLALLSLPCVFGYNIWSDLHLIGGRDVLDTEDFLVSNLLLPIGSLVYLLFCVSKWGWGFDKYIAEVNKGTGIRISPKLKPYFQWILPILILIILVQGLI